MQTEEEDFEEEDTQKDKYLTFTIKDEEYAIEIVFVKEIIRIQKITSIPDMSDYLKGVINLRGKIIPVIDVRTRFNLEFKDYSDRTCIIVVTFNETNIGLIVDSVSDVSKIFENDIELPPKTNKGTKNRFIKGIGKEGSKVKIILNLEQFLNQEDKLDVISELALSEKVDF